MIYYVEDDDSIRELVLYTLRQTGYEAKGFADGQNFCATAARDKPELILLDVMLPGEDGFHILEELRADPDTKEIPVLLITARGAEYDKVRGLDAGADDYIVKPFGMMEFLARVRAALRRNASDKKQEGVLTAGPVVMDDMRHTVTVDNENVALTHKEYELLHTLMEHPGLVFTREKLLDRIWGYDYAGGTRTVDVHVQTLRQKLDGGADMIETVRGVGYRLKGE